jgi:hypothetical protein
VASSHLNPLLGGSNCGNTRWEHQGVAFSLTKHKSHHCIPETVAAVFDV